MKRTRNLMTRTHISLNVADVARSTAFYQAFFGSAPHKQRPGYANFDVAEPPLKLALTERACGPEGGRLNHLGIQVESIEQVLAAKARLQAAGLATFDEMDTTCCYAQQDKIWAHDPDGNAWEVYVITDDMQDEDHTDDAGRSFERSEPTSACCAPCCP